MDHLFIAALKPEHFWRMALPNKFIWNDYQRMHPISILTKEPGNISSVLNSVMFAVLT